MIGGTNSGGGGLNLRIVDGTTKPANPVENMIWLNTDTRVPEWYVQNEAPENPQNGTVYFTIRSATSNKINILRHHTFLFYLGTPRQYINESWVVLDGEVYYDRAWHDIQTFIYEPGTFNQQIGGTWDARKTDAYATGATLTASSDHFTFAGSGNSGGVSVATCDNRVDLTDVKTVRFKYAVRGATSARTWKLAVSTSNGNGMYNSPAVSSGGSNSNVGRWGTRDLDVSGLSGDYYIGMGTANFGGTLYIDVYSIELIS